MSTLTLPNPVSLSREQKIGFGYVLVTLYLIFTPNMNIRVAQNEISKTLGRLKIGIARYFETSDAKEVVRKNCC